MDLVDNPDPTIRIDAFSNVDTNDINIEQLINLIFKYADANLFEEFIDRIVEPSRETSEKLAQMLNNAVIADKPNLLNLIKEKKNFMYFGFLESALRSESIDLLLFIFPLLRYERQRYLLIRAIPKLSSDQTNALLSLANDDLIADVIDRLSIREDKLKTYPQLLLEKWRDSPEMGKGFMWEVNFNPYAYREFILRGLIPNYDKFDPVLNKFLLDNLANLYKLFPLNIEFKTVDDFYSYLYSPTGRLGRKIIENLETPNTPQLTQLKLAAINKINNQNRNQLLMLYEKFSNRFDFGNINNATRQELYDGLVELIQQLNIKELNEFEIY
jgi:hypothetical protein